MLLSVGILTYNQVQYIRQCLDAVLMQDVNFDYEIVVGDDASSDGTQEILREYANRYPNKFVLLLGEKNEGISMNYKKVLSASRGKYIALCEGDDFWTDSRKLQVQVDFLENHPNYGFVGTYNTLLFPNGIIKDDPYDYFPVPQKEGDWELYGDVFEFAKYGPVTRTVSLCFRRKLIEDYIQYVGMGNDMVLQTILAKHSLFAKQSSVMCVYRHGGVSTDKMSIPKQLYYNRWYVENRLLQKKLFPEECNWDEDELADRETYILLKYAIKHRYVKEALQYKKQLKSVKYKNKRYCKYLLGRITCLLLSIKM